MHVFGLAPAVSELMRPGFGWGGGPRSSEVSRGVNDRRWVWGGDSSCRDVSRNPSWLPGVLGVDMVVVDVLLLLFWSLFISSLSCFWAWLSTVSNGMGGEPSCLSWFSRPRLRDSRSVDGDVALARRDVAGRWKSGWDPSHRLIVWG